EEVGVLGGGGEVGVIVKDNIGGLVLQAGETNLAFLGAGVAHVLLKRGFVDRIDVVRGDDQVGLVGAANQREPHCIELALNGRGRECVGARHFAELVAPEGPGGGVD